MIVRQVLRPEGQGESAILSSGAKPSQILQKAGFQDHGSLQLRGWGGSVAFSFIHMSRPCSGCGFS